MNKIKYIISAILAIFCLSCTDEELFSGKDNIEVTASLANTRTSFIEDNKIVNISWNIEDKIGLFTKEQSNLEYTALAEGTTTHFSSVKNNLNAQDGETVYAYYPYSDGAENLQKVKIPDLLSQYYNRNISELDFVYASGVVNEKKLFLQFKHLYAFLRITLPLELIDDRGEKGGLFIQSTENIVSHSNNSDSFFDIENEISNFEGFNALWYYIPANENFEGQHEITCYIAMLPQTENAQLNIYKLKNGATYEEDCLLQKQAPSGGFKAGNVYSISLNTSHPKTERDALIAFYKATNGDYWANNTNWCTEKPISEWYGISTDENGVTGIYLNDNNLKGAVTSELKTLTQLQGLSLCNNELTILNVDNNFKLKNLTCYNNQLTSINVSNNLELNELLCDDNLLTTLDINNNTKLKTLWCNRNQLHSLNVNTNSQLENLLCGDNQLQTLDVKNCFQLKTLWCYSNNLSELDISNNLKLEQLEAFYNPSLLYIYISSGQVFQYTKDDITQFIIKDNK